jgi:hypothetical protein
VSTHTISLQLHKEVRALLEREARRRRTSREALLERIIGEYLQDLVDAREVMRQRRAVAAGREKTFPLAQVVCELGLSDRSSRSRSRHRPKHRRKSREKPDAGASS